MSHTVKWRGGRCVVDSELAELAVRRQLMGAAGFERLDSSPPPSGLVRIEAAGGAIIYIRAEDVLLFHAAKHELDSDLTVDATRVRFRGGEATVLIQISPDDFARQLAGGGK